MKCSRWLLGALAGLILGAAGAEAAPMPLVPLNGMAPVQKVQFFFFDDPPPPVYYDPPPPPRYYYERPRYYDERPRYGRPPRAYYAPPSPGYTVPTMSSRGRQGSAVIYDKEAAKDYMRSYRQTQKEIHKERSRAWNRANGY